MEMVYIITYITIRIDFLGTWSAPKSLFLIAFIGCFVYVGAYIIYKAIIISIE
jgi:hypothetical protein